MAPVMPRPGPPQSPGAPDPAPSPAAPAGDAPAIEPGVLEALDSLPTLPIVALQLGEIVHSKTASVDQVAALLRSDPATSAKLLRLVNSPYFGIPGGVSDVARAIPFVGFSTLYQLVLSISVLDALRIGPGGHDPRALWTHALTVATAARELAEEIRFADPGACFTAGLLHDMGEIALAKLAPDKVAAAFETMRTDGVAIGVAERRHGLSPHDRVGSRLARRWKFPARLATPIEQHHAIHRPEIRDRMTGQIRTITEIVAVADHLSLACHATASTFDPFGEDGERDIAALIAHNGLSAAQRSALCDRTRVRLDRSKVFLALVSG
jgi:putative nucleotidyltransferase with HDIG domain